MNKYLSVIALILVGYFGRIAIEFFNSDGRKHQLPIALSDGSVKNFSFFPGDVIQLKENEIVITHSKTRNFTFTDQSQANLFNRQFGGEKIFRLVRPDESAYFQPEKSSNFQSVGVMIDYRSETGIYVGLNKKTKKVIQGVDLLDSKNNKINLLRQGYGRYIYACPAEVIPNGVYKTRLYLKDTLKGVNDTSRNFFVEWKFRVNAEMPSGDEPPC
jgi:hypothetical protein